MRIGVLSDTHIPDRTDGLPDEILELFRDVDLILHAGDVSECSVLDRLRTIAPVVAVRGNRDLGIRPALPEKTVVRAGPWRIGLIHGTRSRLQDTPDRLRYLSGDHRFLDQRQYVSQAFAADDVHCIVFGHTHQVCRERQGGVLLFNPGGVVRSPGGGPSSIGILDVGSQEITMSVIMLRQPPRCYTLAEQVTRALFEMRANVVCRR